MRRRDFLTHIGATVGTFAIIGGRPVFAQDSNIPAYKMPADFMPRQVRIKNKYPAGELHVDPRNFALYWTLPNNQAMRYTVGIGRPGLYEPGEFYIGAKKEWPKWTPTPDMIEREPHKYERHKDGMPGGISNPLGSRGLYLFQPGRGDTYLRVHGTNAANTIGRRVSNGCARLVNDQMIDLYNRVPMKSRVVLHPIS